MNERNWQWDGRRLPLSAWVGCDHSVVFGATVVLTKAETYLSLWLGPVYLGVGVIW